MRLSHDQRGSSHLVVFLAVAVIAAVGIVGYRVMSNADNPAGTNSSASSKGVPSTLKTKADLTKASKSLDSTAIDSSVNPNQLDKDLGSLL